MQELTVESLSLKRTPLQAADDDRLDVARVLVEHKANVSAKESQKVTPLHFACRNGDLALATLLIEHVPMCFGRPRPRDAAVVCCRGADFPQTHRKNSKQPF